MKWEGIEAVSRDTFMYLTDCCDWHLLSEVGRYHCCKAIVLGYSFILLSLVCPLYSLPLLEVSHMPAGYTRPDLCSKSLTRSAASDVSNVSGSSRGQRGSGTSKASSEASQSSSFNLSSYSRNGTTTSQVILISHVVGMTTDPLTERLHPPLPQGERQGHQSPGQDLPCRKGRKNQS